MYKPKVQINQLVAGRYRVGKKLGSGTFGQIHIAVDIYTKEKVAIKFESVHSRYPRLAVESQVYKDLARGNTGRYPISKWYGRTGECYALVMDLLGTNLENIFDHCNCKFSLKTVIMLAAQMLKLIEYVHKHSYLHRDLKPDNFTIGLGKKSHQVFMIDFGLAKRYRDPVTHAHIPYRDGMGLVGNAIFASINAHDGIEISRRDDLESLGYIFVYFLSGSLPWLNIYSKNMSAAEYFRAIRNKKVSTSIEELCYGFPSEFKTYFRYVHRLSYDQAPDYAYLDTLFRDLFKRKGHRRYDYKFDWVQADNPSSVSGLLNDTRLGKSYAVSSYKSTNAYYSRNISTSCYRPYSFYEEDRSVKSKIGKAIKGLFRGF